MKHYFNINFLRFVSAIGLVIFHLLHYNLPNGFQDYYKVLEQSTSSTYLLVDLFLIISGFFLFKTSTKNTNIFKYIKNRFIRIYPVFLFYNIIMLVMKWEPAFFTKTNIFLLECMHNSFTCEGILWFITPFIWSCILLYIILKLTKQFSKYIIWPLMILCYITMIDVSGGYFNMFAYITPFINFATLRVISGLCIGILLGIHQDKIKKFDLTTIQSSIIETIVICLLFTNLFITKIFINDLYTICLFTVLVYTFTTKKSYISNLINKPFFGYFGRYAYSIYIMQQISFIILNKTSIQYHFFATQTLILYTILSVLIGVLTYYIIEYPIQKLQHRTKL